MWFWVSEWVNDWGKPEKEKQNNFQRRDRFRLEHVCIGDIFLFVCVWFFLRGIVSHFPYGFTYLRSCQELNETRATNKLFVQLFVPWDEDIIPKYKKKGANKSEVKRKGIVLERGFARQAIFVCVSRQNSTSWTDLAAFKYLFRPLSLPLFSSFSGLRRAVPWPQFGVIASQNKSSALICRQVGYSELSHPEWYCQFCTEARKW